MAEHVRRHAFLEAGVPCGLGAGIPDRFVGQVLDLPSWFTGKEPCLGFFQRQYSRRFEELGHNGTSRSLPPLPLRMWITMRSLSMSSTRRLTSSLRRIPVEYNAMRMARACRLPAASIRRATSSGTQHAWEYAGECTSDRVSSRAENDVSVTRTKEETQCRQPVHHCSHGEFPFV